MRLIADKKGMHLNHEGLYLKAGKDSKDQGIRIAGETEVGIFEALGIHSTN